MGIQLSETARQILDTPCYAHMATVLPSGAPLVAPVWVEREGDLVLIGTGEGTQKAKNTRDEPRVALSIVDLDNPYIQLQLRGRIVDRRPDDDFAGMDRIARKYTSEPFPWRHLSGRIVLVFEPDRERLEELPFVHNPNSQ